MGKSIGIVSGQLMLVASVVVAAGCGGGRPGGAGGVADVARVHLSAGTPIQGASVTVYAVYDSTGAVNAALGEKGVLGVGGPTDANGNATVHLIGHYVGPVQVAATGQNLSYVDPRTAASTATQAAVDPGFSFTSYCANFAAGQTGVIPVNLLTTLADAAAKAYANGLHPKHPGAKSISTALAERDPLFVEHVVTDVTAWAPTALRTTVPANLAVPSAMLNDTVFAALFDEALSELAAKTSTQVGYEVTATALTKILVDDVAADGTFDGRGAGGNALVIQGANPLSLNSQYLRIPLAAALDQWMQVKTGNGSGVTSSQLVNRGVFVAMSGDESDLFGEPPAGLYNPVDRASPELSVVKAPPHYTNQSTVAVAVTAADQTGVAAVWCQWGSEAAVRATHGSDGSWSCQFTNRTMNSSSVLAVWAEDANLPVNSGKEGAPPHRLSFPVVLDDKAVGGVGWAANALQYRSEVGMTLVTDGAGRAVAPAAYNYAAGNMSVENGTHIYKTASRLGWAAAPSAAVLEGENPDNIPVVQYSVSFNPLTQAPVVAVTATGTLSSGDSVGPIALWPSARTEEAVVYFDLPLSSNLIPQLASLMGETQLTISLTVTDAAGNTSSGLDGGHVFFNVIGPPVAVSLDANYPASGDPRSTYPYTVAGLNYGVLYDPGSTAFVDGAVRLARLVVTNPHGQPVALQPLANAGAWSASDVWQTGQGATGARFARPQNSGQMCGVSWPVLSDPAGCGEQSSYWTPGGQEFCEKWLTAAAMNSGGQHTVMALKSGAGTLSTVAYHLSPGSEAVAWERSAGGNYIVPAASGGQPGVLVLYVVRSRGSGAQSRPAVGAGPWRVVNGHIYAWEATVSCTPSLFTTSVWIFQEWTTYEDLIWARETWSGSFQPQTFALSATGAEVGEVNGVGAALDVGGAFTH